MGKFSRTLKSNPRQQNNHPGALDAKVEIRARVLAAVGEGRIFDAFAGDGQMFEKVWHKAAAYVGCDTTWYRDARMAYVADNRRVLRAIDLAPFNIFDLDAYGSPWHQALIIAERRPLAAGERIGLVLTEGSGLKLKLGGVPLALRVLAGLSASVPGAGRGHGEILDRAIGGLLRRMDGELVHRWQATGRTGAGMIYVGLVIASKKKPRA